MGIDPQIRLALMKQQMDDALGMARKFPDDAVWRLAAAARTKEYQLALDAVERGPVVIHRDGMQVKSRA